MPLSIVQTSLMSTNFTATASEKERARERERAFPCKDKFLKQIEVSLKSSTFIRYSESLGVSFTTCVEHPTSDVGGISSFRMLSGWAQLDEPVIDSTIAATKRRTTGQFASLMSSNSE